MRAGAILPAFLADGPVMSSGGYLESRTASGAFRWTRATPFPSPSHPSEECASLPSVTMPENAPGRNIVVRPCGREVEWNAAKGLVSNLKIPEGRGGI